MSTETSAGLEPDVQRRLEVSKNKSGRWGWSTVADKDGATVSVGARDFVRKNDAERAADRECALYVPGTACVVVLEE